MNIFISSIAILSLIFLVSCGSVQTSDVKVETKNFNTRFAKNSDK